MNAIFLFVMGVVVGIVIGTTVVPIVVDEGIPDLANMTEHIPNFDDVLPTSNESAPKSVERSETIYQVGDLVHTTPEYEAHYSGSTMIVGEVAEVYGRYLRIEKENGDMWWIDMNWTIHTFGGS